MTRNLALFTATLFTAAGASATPIADSVADFTAAASDGISAAGGPVAPGSPDDAAQQFHTDLTGSGVWTYGYGRSGDGQAFSGGFPLMDVWTGNAWSEGSALVSAASQSPVGSSFTADPMSYRRWTSDGDFTGQTLSAEVRVTLTSAASDGATLVLTVPGGGVSETILIEPSTAGQEHVFDLEFTDDPGRYLLVGILPLGTNGAGGGDFFNDRFEVSVVICAPPTCPTDLNGDDTTDLADLLQLLAAFGATADGDTNNDGVTDLTDLLAVLAEFGNACP